MSFYVRDFCVSALICNRAFWKVYTLLTFPKKKKNKQTNKQMLYQRMMGFSLCKNSRPIGEVSSAEAKTAMPVPAPTLHQRKQTLLHSHHKTLGIGSSSSPRIQDEQARRGSSRDGRRVDLIIRQTAGNMPVKRTGTVE